MFATEITRHSEATSGRRAAIASPSLPRDATMPKSETAKLRTVGLGETERQFLAACQKVYRGNSGITTPFNNFIRSLIATTVFGKLPTSADVETELTEFRENFDNMKGDAAAFMQAYPEEFPEAAAPRPAESRTTLN